MIYSPFFNRWEIYSIIQKSCKNRKPYQSVTQRKRNLSQMVELQGLLKEIFWRESI